MTTDMPVSMDIAHTGFGGYTNTERIILCCGANGTQLWFSTTGGITWTEDTSNVPSIGMETIMWAPSIVGDSTLSVSMGAWIGVDAGSNLWFSINNQGSYWLDTTHSARCIYRTPEFAGWGNTSTNQTFYKFDAISDDTTRGVNYSSAGVLYQDQRAGASSNNALNRARYQWGNGVIMYDREGDFELQIGRYGPIEPLL
jgi:hypothetical protein